MEKEIKEEELFIPKTKHKALKIILAIILIGAMIAGGYFLYKEKFDNPNKTVMSIIEDAEKKVKKDINDTKIYKFNGILKVDANLSSEYKPITDIINKLDLQFILEADANNKIFNTTLNAKYKNDQLMDIKMYSEKDATYILLQDMYDKYLKLAMEDIKGSTTIPEININEDDIKTLSNSISKAIKSNFEKLEFKRVDATIKIDDKDQNVYNNYVDLSDTEFKKLVNDIIDTLEKDNSFNKVFKKIFDGDINSLKNNIDKSFSGIYKINFYTNKNVFNQELVSARIENTVDGVTSSINYDKVNNDEIILLVNTSGGTISSRIKKTNSIFNVNLNINILGMTVKLEFSSNYEKIREVTKPDISNSKKIEELTKEEEEEISKKLQENKGMVSLIEDLSKLNKKTA